MKLEYILLLIIFPSITILLVSIIRGKKILSIFPSIDTVNVQFREVNASGVKTDSSIFKRGGANKVYDVVITDTELWLRTYPLMASIANRMQMIQKLEFNQIISAEMFEEKVDLKFKNSSQQELRILLTLQNPEEFIELINKTQT